MLVLLIVACLAAIWITYEGVRYSRRDKSLEQLAKQEEARDAMRRFW